MMRWIAALLIASFLMLPVWAQAPAGQTAPTQTPVTGEKPADQAQPSDQTPAAAAPTTETTEYPFDRFPNFSAIAVDAPIPVKNPENYIYRSGNLLRSQGDAPHGNYYVTDLTTRVTRAVDTHGCLKISVPATRSFPFFLHGPGVKYELSPAGEETVDGHQCRVEDIKVHDPKNPMVINFRLYEAEDLQGFPIMIKNIRPHAHPWVIRYKDVRLGPQDPTLFMIPATCDSADSFMRPSTPAKPKAATPAAKPQ